MSWAQVQTAVSSFSRGEPTDTPKKKIPLRENLWADSVNREGGPRLIGSRCLECREIFFPSRNEGFCTHCQAENFEEIQLSSNGKIYSYTIVMQRPPIYYRGDVPYAIGYVELPEGVRVETLFSTSDFEQLRIGLDVELVIERLHEDEQGNEVLTYKFRPVVR